MSKGMLGVGIYLDSHFWVVTTPQTLCWVLGHKTLWLRCQGAVKAHGTKERHEQCKMGTVLMLLLQYLSADHFVPST